LRAGKGGFKFATMLLTLPGGTRIRVRPIAPEDKPLLVEGLRRLSPESAFRRFMSPKVSFSQAELRYLTEVDQHDHIALVAVAADDPAQLIAVARCVRVAPDTADIAVVVGDPWQGLGLGRRLADELIRRARAVGIDRIAGTMLADNRAAFRLMRGFGWPFEQDELSGGVREVVARLKPPPAAPIHLP
jgi:RimJ/RimL family protein N-acetyltransferase